MGSFINIPKGARFGLLSFIRRVTVDGKPKCLCRCQCGRETVVVIGKLTTGATKSCGCLRHRTGAQAAAHKHGHSTRDGRSPTHSVWSSMLGRCRQTKHTEWKNYGGRGITVCKRWEEFSNFLADMGERPSLEHTLDRIDNDGGYSPDNCRWATRRQQLRNTRINKLMDLDGSLVCEVEAAEQLGITRSRVSILAKRGFKLSTDNKRFLQTVHTNGRLLTFLGRTQSVTHWAIELGLNRATIYTRLRRGWTIEEALSP